MAQTDVPKCVEMSAAINRALRHTHIPERTNLAQSLALSSPRKIVDESLEDLTVLVIQNSGTHSHLTYQALKGFGVDITVEVPDLPAACEALKLNTYDLVIIHDGDEEITYLPLMQLINASKTGGNYDLPILLLSTSVDIKKFTALKESGLAAFLRAPFDGKSLYRTLKAIFSTSSDQDVCSINYCGPCRRSVENKSTHFTDRRRFEPMTIH